LPCLQPVKPMTKENNQHFQLISGIFAPSDAKQVLLDLVNSKIRYHEIQLHSEQERFGHEPDHSASRLSELKDLHESMKRFFASAEESGARLRVNGWIEIESL